MFHRPHHYLDDHIKSNRTTFINRLKEYSDQSFDLLKNTFNNKFNDFSKFSHIQVNNLDSGDVSLHLIKGKSQETLSRKKNR